MSNHLKLIDFLEIIPNGDVIEIYKIENNNFPDPKCLLALKLQRKRKSSPGYSLHNIVNTIDYDILVNNGVNLYSKIYNYAFLNNIHLIVISEEDICNTKYICIGK